MVRVLYRLKTNSRKAAAARSASDDGSGTAVVENWKFENN